MGTLKVLTPGSFRLLFFTFNLPLALMSCALAIGQPMLAPAAWTLLVAVLAARLTLHFAPRAGVDRPLLSDLWLLPVRELLLCWVWVSSFFTSRLTWRGKQFDVGADGIMRELTHTTGSL
jgi:ceramide glucosyltransferase